MLGQFVAGRYSSVVTYPTLTALSMGIQEEGYRIGWKFFKDVIRKSDQFGASPIEAFHLGLEVTISGVAKEHLPGVHRTIAPHTGWLGTGAAQNFLLGTIGKADTDNAGILVLTATAGTPAAASPTTLTATYAFPMEETDPSLLLGPEHRVFPWRMRIYPFDSGSGVLKFFGST